MFDTVINPVRTEYVTRTVNEYRAPTDESVRLLREMEQKARDEVFASVRLDSNEFKAMFHWYQDALSAEKRVMIQFDLNGRRYQVPVSLKSWESTKQQKDTLVKTLAHEIAVQVLSTMDQKTFHEIF